MHGNGRWLKGSKRKKERPTERTRERKNERKKQLHRVHGGRSTEATERPIRDDNGGCGRRLALASEMWPAARSASASSCRGSLGLKGPSLKPSRKPQLAQFKNSNEFPFHSNFQVMKTLRAYPTAIVFGDVAFAEHIWTAGLHKLRPATFAVIVLPCLALARVLFESQGSPSRPLSVIDTPIAHAASATFLSILPPRIRIVQNVVYTGLDVVQNEVEFQTVPLRKIRKNPNF